MNCIDNYSVGGEYVIESFVQNSNVKYVYCDANGKPLPDQPINKQLEIKGSVKSDSIKDINQNKLDVSKFEKLIDKMEISTKRINSIMSNYAAPPIANQINDLTKQLVILVEQIKLQKTNDLNMMKENTIKELESTKMLTNQIKHLTSHIDSLIKNTIPTNTNIATTLNNLTSKINTLNNKVSNVSSQIKNDLDKTNIPNKLNNLSNKITNFDKILTNLTSSKVIQNNSSNLSNIPKVVKVIKKIKMYRNPVYVLGDYNVNPWNSSILNANNYLDKTAKWIWYTKGANITAPDNSKLPVTFIYSYNNTTGNNMQVKLIGMIDDLADFYLNKKLLAKDLKGNFSPVIFTLIPGINIIKFKARNRGVGPAGLLLSFISEKNNTVLFKTNENWKFLSPEKRKMPITKYCINDQDNKETCLDMSDFMFVKKYKYTRYIRIKSLSGIINLRSITISDLSGKPIDLSKNVKISLIKNSNDSHHTINNFVINNKYTSNDHLNYVINETVERGAYLDIDLGSSYELGKISIINRYDGYNDNLTGAQIILMNEALNPIKIIEYGEAAEVKDFDLIKNTSIASQLVSSKDNVKLYSSMDFTGKGYPMTLLPGSYDNLGAANDRIKSIQISNGTLAIRIYSEKNFKGFTKEFKTSISNLPLVWKHTLRGIKIYPITQSLLSENLYIFPLPYEYGTHDNPFVMLPGVINAEIDIKFKIGSLIIPKNYVVGLSKGPLHNIFLTNEITKNLSNLKFGDNTPLQDLKLKVFPNAQYELIKLYTDTGRRGTHISVRPGDYNNLANFNGRIKSIELDNKNTYAVKAFENTDFTGQTYEFNPTTNNNDIPKETPLKFQSIKIYRYVPRNTVIVYPFANYLGFVGSDKKMPEFIEYSTESFMVNKAPPFLGSIILPKNVTVQFIRDNINSKFINSSIRDLSKIIYGDNFSLVNASIRVHSSNLRLARLYTDGNLRGQVMELMPGDYPNLGWMNDKTVSIKLDPRVVITLYEHSNYGGRQVRIDSTTNNLATFGWHEGKTRKNWLRLASSVKVTLV